MKRSIRAVLLAWILTALVPAFVYAGQAAAPAAQPAAQNLPNGIERVTSVEGITEYRLANGLQVLLFPDQSKQTITVNVTYQVGSRHEGYGETGMAHLLEHMVFKGSPKPSQHSAGADRARLASERHHLVRSHELLRDVRGHGRESALGARPRVGPHGQFVHRQEGSRQRDDRRPQRVRVGENSPTSVLLERVLSTAYLWHNYGKSTIGIALRHRERADRAAAGVLREVLSAGQRRAARRGQVRRAEDARDGRPVLRQDSEARHATVPSFYTLEPTQDGERAVTLRRVGDVQWVIVRVPRAGRGRTRISRRSIWSCYTLGDTAVRPAAQRRWSKRSRPARCSAEISSFTIPGIGCFAAQVRQDQSLDTRSRQPAEDRRGDRDDSADRGRSGARAHNLLTQIELQLNSSDRVGLAAERVDRHGRLAAAVPAPRPPA